MNADIFSYEGEGIQCVYDNKNWVMCIKNWKPNNDIENIRYLEVHHATDEQFVLLKGKAVLLAAVKADGACRIMLYRWSLIRFTIFHRESGSIQLLRKIRNSSMSRTQPPPQKIVNTVI